MKRFSHTLVRSRIPPIAACTFAMLSVGLIVLMAVLAMDNGERINAVISQHSFSIVVGLSCGPVGAVIASLRPKNLVGWLLLTAGFFEVLVDATFEYARRALVVAPGSLPAGDLASWVAAWSWYPGLAALVLFPLLFPHGRLLSRRWRWVLLPVGFMSAAYLAVAVTLWPYRGQDLLELEKNSTAGLPAIVQFANAAFPLLMVTLVAAFISLVLRFWRSRGEERQQMKWFMYAAAPNVAVAVLSNIDSLTHTFHIPQIVQVSPIPLIPIGVGVAVLKYRPYDIDIIINRTLVYGTLTASLAGIYLSVVVGLQYLLRTLTGDESQLVVVASTLLIAVLFNPLRRRLQDLVDRRFYRKKYDAEKTLADFGARLRDETDLDVLVEDLVGVVRETVQPERASLWLRFPGNTKPAGLPVQRKGGV